MNFIRKCSLSVGNLNIVGGTRKQTLRVRFKIVQRTTQSPGTASIFVSNPAAQTAHSILSLPELSPITLSAGYEDGLYGQIFRGNLRQVRTGKDNPTDTYVNIIAADDLGYNWATVNKSLPQGSTGQDLFNALAKELANYNVSVGVVTQKAQQALQQLKYPRSQALFGPVKDYMRTLSHSINSTWSIQNGQLHMVALADSFGGPWDVNVNTGMVGMPMQTLQGILVRTLINPNIRVNSLIHLNNSDIQQATYNLSYTGEANNPRGFGTDAGNNAASFLPPLDADGIYKVLMIEYEGDTRGNNPWYLDLWCLSLSAIQQGKIGPTQLAIISNAAIANPPGGQQITPSGSTSALTPETPTTSQSPGSRTSSQTPMSPSQTTPGVYLGQD